MRYCTVEYHSTRWEMLATLGWITLWVEGGIAHMGRKVGSEERRGGVPAADVTPVTGLNDAVSVSADNR